MDHTKFRATYSTKLAGIGRTALIAMPKDDKAADLARQTRALDAAVKSSADEMALVLVKNCRAILSGMGLRLDDDDALREAIRTDGRAALNRLANMIRNNDPNPLEVPA